MDYTEIAGFCRRNRIRRLAFFGSVLREDFRPESDVDVLVEFEPGHRIGLIGMAGLEIELSQIIGRTVDLRTPQDLSRYFRDRVVASAEVLYAVEEDVVRLRHMLESAQDAVGFVAGRSRADLDTDRMLRLALVRAIEIVGEAANKVTADGRSACQDIPWSQIVGMRNRIVHAYFDIDLDRVWDTVTIDLPSLITEIIKALEDTGSETS